MLPGSDGNVEAVFRFRDAVYQVWQVWHQSILSTISGQLIATGHQGYAILAQFCIHLIPELGLTAGLGLTLGPLLPDNNFIAAAWDNWEKA